MRVFIAKYLFFLSFRDSLHCTDFYADFRGNFQNMETNIYLSHVQWKLELFLAVYSMRDLTITATMQRYSIHEYLVEPYIFEFR